MTHESADLEIFPSILEQTPEKVARFIDKNSHIFTHFQIDIADGMLVNGQTYSVADWNTYILDHQAHIPENCTLEFHLMVQDFLPDIQTLSTLKNFMKIPTILLHFEALQLAYGLDASDYYSLLIRDCPNFEYGIVIADESPLVENLPTIMAFPLVQIMTIEAGSQGRPFNLNALRHIKTLREASYYGKIQLDGGINASTLPQILEQKYLPNAICPGSFLKEETEAHLEELQKLLS